MQVRWRAAEMRRENNGVMQCESAGSLSVVFA